MLMTISNQSMGRNTHSNPVGRKVRMVVLKCIQKVNPSVFADLWLKKRKWLKMVSRLPVIAI